MYFPFMMDAAAQKILVVGGGRVAYRKCALFLEYGAEIIAVAPTFSSDFPKLADRVTMISAHYDSSFLEGIQIAVAATDDREVNAAVSRDCKARNIPVNVVDMPEMCTFIVPATLRRGDLTIGISTGGKSPALAADIRKELEQRYDESYAERLEALGVLRTAVKRTVPEITARRRILTEAARLSPAELREMIALYSPAEEEKNK